MTVQAADKKAAAELAEDKVGNYIRSGRVAEMSDKSSSLSENGLHKKKIKKEKLVARQVNTKWVLEEAGKLNTFYTFDGLLQDLKSRGKKKVTLKL